MPGWVDPEVEVERDRILHALDQPIDQPSENANERRRILRKQLAALDAELQKAAKDVTDTLGGLFR